MRLRFPALLVVLGLSLTSAAFAQRRGRPQAVPEDEGTIAARAHLQSSEFYFNAGKYADAERELTEAYRLRPVPELQYNLGQCYERLSAPDKAVGAYRAYLEGRPEAVDRVEVEGHMAQLQEQMKKQEQEHPPEATGPAEPVPQPVVPPPALPPRDKVVFKEIIVYRAPPPKAGRNVRYAALGLLGLTALGLSIGISFTAINSKIQSSINDASVNTKLGFNFADCMDQSKVTTDQGKALCSTLGVAVDAQMSGQIASYIGYAIAGASAAGAIALFVYGHYLDKKQARELARKGSPPAVSLAPILGPATGMAVLGRF